LFELLVAGMTPAVDIYSFGMCALEMATLEIQGANGDAGNLVSDEQVQRTIEGLEVAIQKDFIRACLKSEPELRPTARELLFHRALFEVSPLKLLAAHTVVKCSGMVDLIKPVLYSLCLFFFSLIISVNTFCKANISETICDNFVVQRHFGPGVVVAEVKFSNAPPVQFTMADVPVPEKLEKFVEDVK